MIKISQANPAILNSKFYTFSTAAINGKHKDTNYVISQMKQYEKQYCRLGLVEVFLQKDEKLAEKLAQSGQYGFSGIIYSNLIKSPIINPKFKEKVATRALEVAEVQGDIVHILARLVDLKMLYKDMGLKKQYAETLLKEEKLLKKIVKDYSTSELRFKTVSKKMSPLETYMLKLAMTKVDIAKGLLRRNPKAAYTRLLAARETFVQFNKTKEVKFVDMLISQIS